MVTSPTGAYVGRALAVVEGYSKFSTGFGFLGGTESDMTNNGNIFSGIKSQSTHKV